VLGVFAENGEAMAFYRALGFQYEDTPRTRFYIDQLEVEAIVSRRGK
jgi:ribosomal protein S18 acetylase RimI-like enzyme